MEVTDTIAMGKGSRKCIITYGGRFIVLHYYYNGTLHNVNSKPCIIISIGTLNVRMCRYYSDVVIILSHIKLSNVGKSSGAE